ncbi:hypothetical protein [Colwellia sp. RSH04]|uniref:hypothetical protein n=1 Tax=Colwellia sp. RSH04 TaxID=2305464 RepID=UPI000E57F888|nr:hypothetical protein [Colwellia sp. RSH04]RHW77587.1 hypothetical protein D1094_01140 [Colwellia sp. RSH04]
MRQILMSKPNEFSYHKERDQIRSVAVKMFAKVISSSKEDSAQGDSNEVKVSSTLEKKQD